MDALLGRLLIAMQMRDERNPVAHVRTSLAAGVRRVLLKPLHQLQVLAGAAGIRWVSAGDDPQMLLDLTSVDIVLPAGWYRFRCRLQVLAGHLVSPCLYADQGSGFKPNLLVRIPAPDATGRIDMLFVLPRNTVGVRIDPSSRSVEYSVSDFKLIREPRWRALLFMLLRREESGCIDWNASTRLARNFLRTLIFGGLSAAADHLMSQQPYAQQPSGFDYTDWVRRFDTLDESSRNLCARVSVLSERPLISVLVPVYNTPERWLRRCLDSVLKQAYPHWELCIADDASPAPHVQHVLREYADRDERIRIVRREENGHISAASNSALALANGEYVALLDHDDELRPHALLEIAEAINQQPTLEVIYSDEDKIDEKGRRFQPYFKPDWNPQLLLSQNYLCHLTVIRTERVRCVGGFRAGFEGSQDHDLFLRCCGGLSEERIRHIPKVLYHWRAIEGSTALERDAKDYASLAGARAVREHVSSIEGVRVEELPHGHYRVRWPLPSPVPKVSIIIPTRDKVDLLRKCIESLFERTKYADFECIVVNNQSSEPLALRYLHDIAGRAAIRVLDYDAPFNYSKINNLAAEHAQGSVLCLMNNDIEIITEDWLEEMVSHAVRPDTGAVGAMLYYPDGTIQHAGVILGVGGVANHAYLDRPAGYPGHGARALVTQNLSAVTGACMVVRRSVYFKVGGLEERLSVAFNDIDFCLRLLEAGYRNVWTPHAQLIHHESATRGSDDSKEKRQRFVAEVDFMHARWDGLLQSDPAYNPNLALDDCSAALSYPPRHSAFHVVPPARAT
ncbi:Glycosyltransferase, GT2 family [Pseudoxanthomonas wuyuanensis]|uniref:Glycosyltransferase, GT2 family n=2 Tax=Pseudoxanthomonas wuyuanensis TaxID=1073196 RepID=A0A286D6V8_9GAMM|nr:Glycosyltransferase, GT2 family [Pseudoxanthomonas wuyuanensis]